MSISLRVLRLFDVHLGYTPRVGEAARRPHRPRCRSPRWRPVRDIHFGVRKYGAYHLRLDRRRSEYFYDDTILPATLASFSGSTGGDFHRFDFERSVPRPRSTST